MLTIRLTRKGKKNQPFFRVVLVDKRKSSTGGRAVEDLGYVDPIKKRKNLKIDRIKYWISKGAQPSATIHNWLVSEKVVDSKKIHVSKLSRKAKEKIAKTAADAAAKIIADKKAIEDAAAAKVAAEKAKAEEEAKAAEAPAVAETETQPAVEEKPAE